MQIEGQEVGRVALVDDQREVREAYRFTVEDANLTAVAEEGPLLQLHQAVDAIAGSADAVICDQQLQLVKGYADFSGAELVARFYGRRFPALLCTKWEDAHLDLIRSYRRFIPIMIRPDELNPDSLIAGMTKCIREFVHGFSADRRPWRTQVHVVDVDGGDDDGTQGVCFVELPAWSRDEIVRVRLQDLPPEFREKVEPGFRCHAHVNTGTEAQQDLFFEAWER